LYPAIEGLIGGIISTAAMTLSEIPSWKRWGLHGVFEWHENQIITTHLLHLSDAKRNKNHFKGVFFFHFLNGSLADSCLAIFRVSVSGVIIAIGGGFSPHSSLLHPPTQADLWTVGENIHPGTILKHSLTTIGSNSSPWSSLGDIIRL
jgi:hypothetical protein